MLGYVNNKLKFKEGGIRYTVSRSQKIGVLSLCWCISWDMTIIISFTNLCSASQNLDLADHANHVQVYLLDGLNSIATASHEAVNHG